MKGPAIAAAVVALAGFFYWRGRPGDSAADPQELEFLNVERRREAKNPSMIYFEPAEFGIWWPFMAPDLLHKLDQFRARWGEPVEVSSASGALGRHGGESESQHNIDAWGEIRAVDVFPRVGAGYIDNAADRYRAYKIAREVGFSGIGLYTDTAPGNMLHVDVRTGRRPGDPAKWARVDGNYTILQAVI